MRNEVESKIGNQKSEIRNDGEKLTEAEVFGRTLDEKVARGEMTPQEAEDEYQDFLNRGEGRYGWSWQR